MPIYSRANSVPLPPPEAERYNTVCQYCNVGCGYHVYVWPNGTEGGPKPDQNAFAADFTVPQAPLTGITYTELMHATIRRNDGRGYHVAIVPAKDSPINLLGNHSSRGGSNARTTWSDSRPTQARLHYPLLRVGDDFNPIPWDAAIELQARVMKGILDRYGSDQLAAKIFDHGGGGGGMENTYGTGRLLFTGLQMVYTGIHNRPAYSSETFGYARPWPARAQLHGAGCAACRHHRALGRQQLRHRHRVLRSPHGPELPGLDGWREEGILCEGRADGPRATGGGRSAGHGDGQCGPRAGRPGAAHPAQARYRLHSDERGGPRGVGEGLLQPGVPPAAHGHADVRGLQGEVPRIVHALPSVHGAGRADHRSSRRRRSSRRQSGSRSRSRGISGAARLSFTKRV